MNSTTYATCRACGLKTRVTISGRDRNLAHWVDGAWQTGACQVTPPKPEVVAGRRFDFKTGEFRSYWTVYLADEKTCGHRHPSRPAAERCAKKQAA